FNDDRRKSLQRRHSTDEGLESGDEVLESSVEGLEREWTSVFLPRLRKSNIKIFQETATRLGKTWRSQKMAKQSERFKKDIGNQMQKVLSKAILGHRATTLQYSSSTLAKDFQTHVPMPPLTASKPSSIYTQFPVTRKLSASTRMEPTKSMTKAESAKNNQFYFHYFVGGGCDDSGYKDEWESKEGTPLTKHLLQFRASLAKDQSLIIHPHHKLAVNFVFLLDGKFEMAGLQEEIDDTVWHEIWNTITIPNTQVLDREIVLENADLAMALASGSHEDAKGYLKSNPVKDSILGSIYSNAVRTQDFWVDQSRNEDTFVKMFISPIMDAIFGDLKSTFTQ
ncbi:hypothetical protein BGX27_008237, partial [Mortierella sp. AM989]